MRGADARELRHFLELGCGKIEDFADLAHRRAKAIGGERTDQANVVVAVPLVDAADQLLADLARKIEIDIGNRSEGLIEKSSEEQTVRDRVDVREAQQVADN